MNIKHLSLSAWLAVAALLIQPPSSHAARQASPKGRPLPIMLVIQPGTSLKGLRKIEPQNAFASHPQFKTTAKGLLAAGPVGAILHENRVVLLPLVHMPRQAAMLTRRANTGITPLPEEISSALQDAMVVHDIAAAHRILGAFFDKAALGVNTGISKNVDFPAVKPTVLARSRPGEAAVVFEALLSERLDRALEQHPEIKTVTLGNIRVLTTLGPSSFDLSLGEALEKMLTRLGQKQARPRTFKRIAREYALSILSQAVDREGYVREDRIISSHLLLGEALSKSNEENAMKAALDPSGISLKQILALWKDVQEESGREDSQFLYPVRLGRDSSAKAAARALGIGKRAGLSSKGEQAVADFMAAGDGPGDLFQPVAKQLKAPGIKNLFFFQGSGDDWATNILVVVDDKGQAWGFEMGYTQ
ncbi:MAG: hypothetical protein HY921_11620 [Elusimicrobia bacterium]|nr:hypothetical protein [Elusimicrobiota bacterium]